MNKRKIVERRSWANTPQTLYPFIDSEGTVVSADRRQQADRRTEKIQARWR